MKSEFVIVSIERRYDDQITLKTRKCFPPPKPEPEPTPEPPSPSPLETFVPQTEEEKYAIGFLKTLVKLGLYPFPRSPLPRVYTRCVPLIESTISLTAKEYKDLGRPGIGQKLTMDLGKTE